MKRSPIQRKTPLRQGSIARGGTPLRTSPLRKRSKKTAEKYKNERIPLVKKMLEEYPVCYVCTNHPEIPGGTWWAIDLHEIMTRGRTGGVNSTEWLDPDNIITVCRPHHGWITENPDKALEKGLVKRYDHDA